MVYFEGGDIVINVIYTDSSWILIVALELVVFCVFYVNELGKYARMLPMQTQCKFCSYLIPEQEIVLSQWVGFQRQDDNFNKTWRYAFEHAPIDQRSHQFKIGLTSYLCKFFLRNDVVLGKPVVWFTPEWFNRLSANVSAFWLLAHKAHAYFARRATSLIRL